MSRINWDDAELIKAWLAGETDREIAARFGAERTQVASRLQYLKRRGLKLPPRAHGRGSGADIKALQALVNKATK